MLKNSLVFVMKDSGVDKDIKQVFDEETAVEYNKNKYGVFFSVNGFKDRRIKENLININAWAVDIDNLSKEKQKELILSSPLPPSLVIESKNGFHLYWFSKDATKEKYEEIEQRLVNFFHADLKARDLCRILRYPNYYHWKNENDPFMVSMVWNKDNLVYSEEKMLSCFKPIKTFKRTYSAPVSLNTVDNIKALEILSGKPEVRGEVFTFKKNSSGYQILVDGRTTSSWIDKEGLIGSYERGGCSWVNWVMWYGYTRSEALSIGEKYGIKS